MMQVNEAVSRLFRADELRLAPGHAARLLLGFVFTNRMGTSCGSPISEPAELVDLFLHGAISTNRGEPA